MSAPSSQAPSSQTPSPQAPDAAVTVPAGVALPAMPPSAPQRPYSAVARALGRLVLRLLGWSWRGGFPDVPRSVLVGWPHTSNWDGVVALSAMAVCGVRVRIFAKAGLFRTPVGGLLRAFGGVPIDRDAPGDLVDQAVRHFAESEARGEPFMLGLAPEGTRGRAPRWKSGFHRIARAARVPISVAVFDYARKEVGVVGTIVPSDDLDADLAVLDAMLAGITARHPELATPPL